MPDNDRLREALEWVRARCEVAVDGHPAGGPWSHEYLIELFREIKLFVAGELAADEDEEG
jgi:hypothetical protein